MKKVDMSKQEKCPHCGVEHDPMMAESGGKYWLCGTSQWGEKSVRQWRCYMNEIEQLKAKIANLPAPVKLELLADWFDTKYPDNPDKEVQNDLRQWAQKIRELSIQKG